MWQNLSCENFVWTERVKLMWCLSIYHLVCKYCCSESGLICAAWKLCHAVESFLSLLVCCKLWGLCCLRDLKQCESQCVKESEHYRWSSAQLYIASFLRSMLQPYPLFASELKTAIYHTHKRELLALKKLMHIVSCLVFLYSNWYSSTLLIFLARKGRIFLVLKLFQ